MSNPSNPSTTKMNIKTTTDTPVVSPIGLSCGRYLFSFFRDRFSFPA